MTLLQISWRLAQEPVKSKGVRLSGSSHTSRLPASCNGWAQFQMSWQPGCSVTARAFELYRLMWQKYSSFKGVQHFHCRVGIAGMCFAEELAGGSFLGRSVSGFLSVLWCGRLIFHLFFYGRLMHCSFSQALIWSSYLPLEASKKNM